MATRKIRLTLSSKLHDGVGAIADIDFDDENLDADLEVNAEHGNSTLIKEYTVDVAPGSYNLNISFKNDFSDETSDRNLYIESVETANDGVNYQQLILSAENSNVYGNYGYYPVANPDFDESKPIDESNPAFKPNPDFNENLDNTDTYYDNSKPRNESPGDNAFFVYEFRDEPATMYVNGTATIAVSFT